MGPRPGITKTAAGALGLCALMAARSSGEEALRLSLPIVCEPQKTCFIQNYVDVDPSAGVQDHRCGSATYDGHKGTDFRVLSLAAAKKGVAVVSSADGTIKGVRDGVADAFWTPADKSATAGRECGNGVVVDHGQGWETQYCHMMRGSVKVRPGDRVSRGDVIGAVGLSGFTQFAHVHLEVRKDGKTIDPFSGRSPGQACEPHGEQPAGLWDEQAAKAFGVADATVLGAGFAADATAIERLETDDRPPEPVRTSDVILFYLRAANVKAGDRVSFRLEGPDGVLAEATLDPYDRPKAMIGPFIGKKKSGAEWPTGPYQGIAKILRDGKVIAQSQSRMELK